MNTISFCIMVTIAVYLLMMLAIGFIYSKDNSDSTDFYLGGRKMGPLVTAMSAEASDMSSWLLMGIPGLAYFSGICEPFWTILGLGVGTYLNWLLVSKKLRRYSSNIDAYTIPQFFSKRFHDEKNHLSAIAALVIIIFFVPYTASGFAACGKLFHSLFGVNYVVAMVASALIITGYTIMGGFKAVSTTDFIQSAVMTVALVVVLGFAINVAGGWNAVMDNAKALPGHISLSLYHDVATNSGVSYGGVIAIISTLAWGLGYFGMPHILLRFMAIENEKKLTLSRRVATVWVFIAMGLAAVIGLAGLAVTSTGKIEFLDTASSAETIIVKLSDLISQHGIFAAIVAGLILAGILAATMSTADSQMLAAASSVSENIMGEFFKVKMDEKKKILVARIAIVGIAALGVILALDPDSSVFRIVSFAWAGFGGAFGPVMLLALFWKRTTKQGALAGMIGGGAMVFIWKFLIKPLGGAFSIYELLPAFIVSLILTVVVSLATKEPDKSIIEEFEKAA
ncbi:MAG: sodium/proline symporter [Lachnospiraceae bacterium]|nr:sodium/proline symporter [Lachnospiraceae bacterium]MBR4992718.1 sodium/proline symporter [Lachnospiraceae bacterium]